MLEPKSKRQLAKQRAESMRGILPPIEGDTPNPCKLVHVSQETDDAIDVEAYKAIDCQNYHLCSRIAAIANWDDLSCRACPVFKGFEARIRFIRRVRKQTHVRIIRRIRKVVCR